MTHWRMQLHPARPGEAIRYTVGSLAAGFIGLDFGIDVGDLKLQSKDSLPEGQKDYWDFAHKMRVGECVLIIAHNFPFALATIAGRYNYIREVAPELGVWFRHFRRVKNVRYYGDLKTNMRSWEQIKMSDAISPLLDPAGKSYQLIEAWLNRS